MYLKAIQTQGFKSFADKIDLELGRGITTIVGPNGSGKSNVTDAVRWALGEQSAKTLRGGNMQDVIFAGTQKRKPLGFAQVVLTLDNADRAFNVDSDEVKITRRVHRSGESEYAINNNSCRLKDVHELFMDTGLGRDGYSIIGQGKIDEVLSSKSEDRRAIFEEASGISKYKYRKLEAERKLNQTNENLLRIKDIIAQLEEQVGPLENQAKKARVYLDLREKLKGLDINIALFNIEKHKENIKKTQEDYQNVLSQLNGEKSSLDALEKKIEESDGALTVLLSDTNDMRQQLFELEKSSGGLFGKIEILKNDIENNNQNKARLADEIKTDHDKIDAIDLESKNQVEKINQKNALMADEVKNIEALTVELDKVSANIDTDLEEIDSLKSDMIEYLNEVSSLKAKDSGFDAIIKSFSDRKEAVTEDIEDKKTAISDKENEIKAISAEIKKNDTEKDNALKELEKLKTEYFKIMGELDSLKKEQNEKASQLNEKQSRHKVLTELERGYEGYYKSVKSVLNMSMSGVHGVVSKLIEVEDKYITAIEIALGSAVQNIVVDSEDTAKKAIEYLKKNKLGRATFLPVTAVKGSLLDSVPKGEKGYLGIASEIIKYDTKYDGIFKSLLGRVVVADNIDNAISISKKYKNRFKIVTLAGDILSSGGAMSGGSISQNQRLLSRAKDIEALKAEIVRLQKEIDKLDKSIEKISDRVRDIAKEKEMCDTLLQKCENVAIRLSSEINHANIMLVDAKRSYESLTSENGDILKEISDIEKDKADISEKIFEIEEKITKTREILTKKESLSAERGVHAEEINNRIVDKKIVINNITKDIEVANAQINTLAENRISIENDIKSKEAQMSALTDENGRINAEIADIVRLVESGRNDTKNLSDKIDEYVKKYEADSAFLKDMQRQSKEKSETIYVLSQEVSRLEGKSTKSELEMEMVINKLWDEYELTYTTSLEYKRDDFVIAPATKEAASLRSQIKALGNINIDAIDEYKAVKEKYDFLSTQKKDLDESKSKLEDIIKEMQSAMTDKFKESFEVIKEKFDRIFKELFGGGNGKLTLTDPSNVLESGIEIEVQPPGKKLKNLMALSGGERAFTAIALLFAVLEVKAAPFCILDEVEAPLDDVNVYRFANYIKKYSGRTQFIIVTHKRGTMEAADIMYGVTMQEKGVSKILKLKFDDLEDYDVK